MTRKNIKEKRVKVDTYREVDIHYVVRRHGGSNHCFEVTLPEALGGETFFGVMCKVKGFIDNEHEKAVRRKKRRGEKSPVLLFTQPRTKSGNPSKKHTDATWFSGQIVSDRRVKHGRYFYKVKVRGYAKPWVVREDQIFSLQDVNLSTLNRIAKEFREASVAWKAHRTRHDELRTKLKSFVVD